MNVGKMMRDLQTMEDNTFIAMMRDFFATYGGSRASTQDFQAVLEKHIGRDMQWFMDQWVYGTHIPTYEFAYHIEPLPTGEYLVQIRVGQRDVPPGFQMYVPIYVDYGEDRFSQFQLLVSTDQAELEFPPLPLKPRDIILNPREAVLAKVDKKGW